MPSCVDHWGRGTLERIKALDEDVGENQNPSVTGMVFVESAKDTSCNKLTQSRASDVDRMWYCRDLLSKKLNPIHEEAVH
jgi:hypothetical protein